MAEFGGLARRDGILVEVFHLARRARGTVTGKRPKGLVIVEVHQNPFRREKIAGRRAAMTVCRRFALCHFQPSP